MKPKIFVTRLLPEAAMQRLAEYFEVEVNPNDRVLTREELLEGVKGADALLCTLQDTVDEELMRVGGQLKVISNYAVGYNNIDIEAAKRLEISVGITPGVLTEASADLTWALLLATCRRVLEGDRMMRRGEFDGWAPLMLLGSDVYGKTLGIVGAGRIGQAVGRRAVGFGMRILYTSRSPKQDFEKETGAERVSLDELLSAADFVSLHAPLTPETTHLIGERELEAMKASAYLINTARGPIVDEKALVRALQKGTIAGAGLDVFEEEPAMQPGLSELDNVVLLPHIGSATSETRTAMGLMAAENAIGVLEGRKLETLV